MRAGGTDIIAVGSMEEPLWIRIPLETLFAITLGHVRLRLTGETKLHLVFYLF